MEIENLRRKVLVFEGEKNRFGRDKGSGFVFINDSTVESFNFEELVRGRGYLREGFIIGEIGGNFF